MQSCTLDPPRLDRVVYTGDGFEIARYITGEPDIGAMIFAVRDHVGDPIDLAAWNGSARRPASWCARACMIGAENLFRPRMREAIEVHPSPLDWLRAACRGVVIIDGAKVASLLYRAEPLQARAATCSLSMLSHQ